MDTSTGSFGTHWVPMLKSIAAQNEQAFTSFYDETSPRVYGLALRILENQADADEVTIDVYAQVWRTASSYSPEKGSPLGWLLMITRSRALDRLRSRPAAAAESVELDTLAISHGDPEAAAGFEQRARLLTGFLADLPVEQRVLIELCFLQGLTQSQLASSLSLPLGTVKTRMRLGMNKLRLLVDANTGRRQP